jgi:acyl-CoA-binding protein
MALPELKEFCMPATPDEVASLLEKPCSSQVARLYTVWRRAASCQASRH